MSIDTFEEVMSKSKEMERNASDMSDYWLIRELEKRGYTVTKRGEGCDNKTHAGCKCGFK